MTQATSSKFVNKLARAFGADVTQVGKDFRGGRVELHFDATGIRRRDLRQTLRTVMRSQGVRASRGFFGHVTNAKGCPMYCVHSTGEDRWQATIEPAGTEVHAKLKISFTA